MDNLYTIDQIRALERLAVDEGGVSEAALMARAGESAFQCLLDQWPQAKKIIAFAGKGNNGGDGYVLARLAKEHGLEIELRSLGEWKEQKGIARAAAQAAFDAGVPIQPYQPDEALTADVLVDALLGIGLKGEVRGDYHPAIAQINRLKLPVLAIDLPSGLDADTGNVFGIAIRATVTITFIGYKRGLFTHQGPTYRGRLYKDELGLPPSSFEAVPSQTRLVEAAKLVTSLPPRQRHAHKGDFGHVLVIGGNQGMAGAATMAAQAAYRAGAGLVSVATHSEHVGVITSACPEVMCHSSQQVETLLPKATVVAIGPGLGQDAWAKNLFEKALLAPALKVIDADALNLLAQLTPVQARDDWVLTPHPGEAARLLAVDSAKVQSDRFAAIAHLKARYGGVCVLKGAGTIVTGDDDHLYVCPVGNPGMATGGMGDVLTGVIAGLLAQGLSLEDAAQVGVIAHGIAADQVAGQHGERGLMATDLLPTIPDILNP